MTPFTLIDFVRESNRIESITREPTENELNAHKWFLMSDEITVEDLQQFVSAVAPGHTLRDKPGMDVRVGNHFPPAGGHRIDVTLRAILEGVKRAEPYLIHHAYETLHPFTDGNGRSGRALWLWMMGGIEKAPLGFLHTWYYQSLSARRK